MLTLGFARSSVIYLSHFQNYYDNIDERKKVMFLVLPMVLSGLMAPFSAILCSQVRIKYVMLAYTILGFIFNFLAIQYFWRVDQMWWFLGLSTIGGSLFGNLMLVVPIEINTVFESSKRVMMTAIAFTGSSIGALWIGPVFSSFLDDLNQEGDPVCGNQTASVSQVHTGLADLEHSLSNQTDLQPEYPSWIQSYSYLVYTQFAVLMFSTALFFTPRPANFIDHSESNKAYRPGFKHLYKYKLYGIYLIFNVFYITWRSGYLNLLVDHAIGEKCFSIQQAALLLTIEAVGEVFFRPTIGRIAEGRNLYFVLFLIFIVQGFLTFLQPYFTNYYLFSVIVFLIGGLQGGSGGLFMQVVTKSTNDQLARYAYSMSSTIGVFISGFATYTYGVFGDIVGRSESEIFGLKLSSNYVFFMAGVSSLVASLVCLYGSAEMEEKLKREENQAELIERQQLQGLDGRSEGN